MPIEAKPVEGDEREVQYGGATIKQVYRDGAWRKKETEGSTVSGNESTEKAKAKEQSTEGAKEGDTKPGPLGTTRYFWGGAWHNSPKPK